MPRFSILVADACFLVESSKMFSIPIVLFRSFEKYSASNRLSCLE
jgi:hypothetical protein